MKTYGQFCPIAQALEIVGERWTLLVVRELSLGSTRFSELCRGVPLMSRTMLSQRLRSLEDAGVLRRTQDRRGPKYTLTDAGRALEPLLESIGHWGKAFAHRGIPDEHLDPKLLMWDVQRRLCAEKLPKARTVVLFRFSDARKGERRFWLCMDGGAVDLCLTNPGYEVDLTVDTDVRTFTEIWVGNRSLAHCTRSGSVVLRGDRALVRAFPGWLLLSIFATNSVAN